MGTQIQCDATVDGIVDRGFAQLETDTVMFRGTRRVKIALSNIQSVEASPGILTLVGENVCLTLALGKSAETWCHKILHPRTLLDKLGVTPWMKVWIEDCGDPGFKERLELADVVDARPHDSDMLFLWINTHDDLRKFFSMQAIMLRESALWIIMPKGLPDLRDADVIEAGRSAGFVDIKVVRFSETHMALKFVVPKKDRDREGAARGLEVHV